MKSKNGVIPVFIESRSVSIDSYMNTLKNNDVDITIHECYIIFQEMND